MCLERSPSSPRARDTWNIRAAVDELEMQIRRSVYRFRTVGEREASRSCFNSPTHAGCDLVPRLSVNGALLVSTHPSNTGCDAHTSDAGQMAKVSAHALLRDATGNLVHFRCLCRVSTHAPAAGSH